MDAANESPQVPKIVLGPVEPSEDRWNEPDFSQTMAEASQLMEAKSYAAAAELLESAFRASSADAQESGPGTGRLLVKLGICRYELREWQTADLWFRKALEIARNADQQRLVGTCLYELSLVAWERGDARQAVELARESLVVVVCHMIRISTPRGRFSKAKFREEPIEALSRLAFLLMVMQHWDEAQILYGFVRDSYEARNDLPLLCKTLIRLSVVAIGLKHPEQAEDFGRRAIWTGRIAGVDVDAELANHGIRTVPREPGEILMHSDGARRAPMESSLIEQVREIAVGLVAHRLMLDGDLSERSWWHQFSSLRRPPPPFLEDYEDREFQAFQDEILESVVARRITPISPSDLMSRTVKLVGVDVYFWQEGTINRALAEAGSSLRLFIAASDVVRASKLLSVLGDPSSAPVTPSSFILGEVRPMTAIGKANLFDFTREYAVSPYVNPESAGLHDQGRIVLRQVLHGHAAEFQANAEDEATVELRANIDERRRAQGVTVEELISSSTLSHELGHVFQFFPPGVTAAFSSWHAIVRDDICRFAQTPRTLGEIWAAFQRTFEGLSGSFSFFTMMFPPGESPVNQPLESTLAGLLRDGLLQRLPDDRFHFTGIIRARSV